MQLRLRLLLIGLGGLAIAPAIIAQTLPTRTIELPKPALTGEKSLQQCIAQRRSVRRFEAEGISQEQLSQLLWAGQGITGERGLRAAPSAGATYPLDLYAFTADGVWQYIPDTHSLMRRGSDDLRPQLADAARSQRFIRDAAVSIVIVAEQERTARRYGQRAEKYVLLEAGHVAQNILLQAVSLGLGGVPVGAADDDAVAKLLNLPPGQQAVYVIVVGKPQE